MSSENRPTDQINSSVIYDVTRARAAVFENRSIPQPPVKNSSNRDAGNGGTNSPSAAARKPRKTPALESVEYEVPEGLAMGTTVKKGVADVEEYQVVDLHGPTVDDADVSRTETQEGAEPKVEPVQGNGDKKSATAKRLASDKNQSRDKPATAVQPTHQPPPPPPPPTSENDLADAKEPSSGDKPVPATRKAKKTLPSEATEYEVVDSLEDIRKSTSVNKMENPPLPATRRDKAPIKETVKDEPSGAVEKEMRTDVKTTGAKFKERLQKTSTTTTLVAPENDESQGQPEQVVQPKKKPPLPPAGPAPIRTTSAPRTPGIGPAPPRPKHGPSSLPRPHTIQPLGRSWQPQPDIYGVCQVNVGEDTAVDVVMEEKRPVSHHFWSYVACCFCPLFGFMSWLKAEESRRMLIERNYYRAKIAGNDAKGLSIVGICTFIFLVLIFIIFYFTTTASRGRLGP